MVVAAMMLLTVVGCGSVSKPSAMTADNGDRINSADVGFVSDMVVHHAQALQLVNLLRDRSSSEELRALGDRLLTEQAAQNEVMVNWLTEWGEKVPETPLDHVNGAHEGDDEAGMRLRGDEMPGLLSSDQVEDLEVLRGDAFDEAWVDLMTEQQQGAIKMAEIIRRDGVFAPVRKLARTISAQHAKTLNVLGGIG